MAETFDFTGVSAEWCFHFTTYLKNNFGCIEKIISHLHQQNNKNVLRNLQHTKTANWFSPSEDYTISGVQSTVFLDI